MEDYFNVLFMAKKQQEKEAASIPYLSYAARGPSYSRNRV